jgi:hypothetical protein
MPEKTLQVVSVTAADNNLDLTVGNRRDIRTNCGEEWDIWNIAQGATRRGDVAAPVGEGAATRP